MNKIEAVNLMLEDIRKHYLGKHSMGKHGMEKTNQLNVECLECIAKIFEGYLVWYRDLLEWETMQNEQDEKNRQ